ncbi:MAG: hypothetical protein HY326_11880 [Chloroflexi bacterium]|nr:hypothetical protein [Chloroflexota bacterium]
MANVAVPAELNRSRDIPGAQPISGLRFDWLMVIANSWFLAGLFLDGWAHNHIRQLETFFTPWHAVFYSGFLVSVCVLALPLFKNRPRGAHRWLALPAGYELSLLGAIVFAFGGIGDMIWHILFGIEANVEALLSPTHLTLALGGALMATGPFRAAWQRRDTSAGISWGSWLPLLLSWTFTFSLLTFMTQFTHPFVDLWPASRTSSASYGQIMGIDSILLQTGLLMSFILLVLRRWRLPLGSFTLVFTLNAALMSTQHDHFSTIWVAAIAGLATDILNIRLQPSVDRPNALRLFAFTVPVVFYLLYFLLLTLTTRGITWSIHLWSGSVFMAGIVGLLLSYLLLPPSVPPSTEPGAFESLGDGG